MGKGCFAATGSCYGNCTHVWNYEHTTPFLFGNLAMKMREVEYQRGLNDSSGLMSFRVALPFNKNKNWKLAAARRTNGNHPESLSRMAVIW